MIIASVSFLPSKQPVIKLFFFAKFKDEEIFCIFSVMNDFGVMIILMNKQHLHLDFNKL